MNTVQRLAKNAAALYLGNLVTALVLLCLSVVIARTMGDAAFGKYSLSLTLATILTTFISLGYDTLLLRDVARDRSLAPRYLGNFLVLTAIFTPVFFGLMTFTVFLMGYPPDTVLLVVIFGGYGALTAFSNMFKVTFRAFERMEFETLSEISGRIITIALGLAALFTGYGLTGLAAAFLCGGLIDLLISGYLCCRRFTRPVFEFDRRFLKKATASALPIGFLSISAIIFARVNTVMLSAMAGDAVVGWYNAAANLVLALKLIPFVLATIILPLMSRSFNTASASLTLAYEKSLYYLIIIGLPLSIGISLLADRIIDLFYGAAFAPSVIVLRLLGWDVLLFFIYMPLGTLLISIDRQNEMALSCAIAAGFNIVINLVIIPAFGYAGASAATLITEALLCALYFFFVARYLHALLPIKLILRPAAAGAVMGVFVFFGHDLNPALLITLSAVIYLSALILFRAISHEEWELLRQMINIPRVFRNKSPESESKTGVNE